MLNEYFFDVPYIYGFLPALNFRHEMATSRQFNEILSLTDRIEVRQDILDELRQLTGRPTHGDVCYVAQSKVFKQLQGKQYAFNANFLDALVKSELTNIYDMFPKEEWSGYVALPKDKVFAQNSKLPQPVPIVGMYMSYIRPEKSYIALPLLEQYQRNKSHVFNITALSHLGEGKHGQINLSLEVNEKIKDLNSLLRLDMSEVESNSDFLMNIQKTAILCMLYIHTAQPDLRHLLPKRQLSKSMLLNLKNKGIDVNDTHSDQLVMPVELVSWGWKKPHQYTKDEWEIRARFNTYWTGKGRTTPITMWLPPTVGHRQ